MARRMARRVRRSAVSTLLWEKTAQSFRGCSDRRCPGAAEDRTRPLRRSVGQAKPIRLRATYYRLGVYSCFAALTSLSRGGSIRPRRAPHQHPCKDLFSASAVLYRLARNKVCRTRVRHCVTLSHSFFSACGAIDSERTNDERPNGTELRKAQHRGGGKKPE